MPNTVIKHFNEEVIVNSESREQAIEELLNKYEFMVEETDEEIVEFEGVNMLASRKAEILANREEMSRLAQVKEIKEQLDALDLRSQRSVRAIINGTGTQTDRDYLADLEQQAVTLRVELNNLQAEV